MSYKLLVLDIDGTLLNSEKKISKKTKDALKDAQESGVIVVLASGRPTQGIVSIAQEIGLDKYGGYILSFNGAIVTNIQTGEVVFETVLPHHKIKELYDLAKRYTYSDRNLALKYINQAINEVGNDIESYFLYKRRSKIKEGLGDHLGAKEDFEQYEKMKTKVDIKRVHALKHQAQQEDSAFAYYYLAYACEQIKDYEGAIEAINKAIERTDLNQHYKRYRTELVKVYQSL